MEWICSNGIAEIGGKKKILLQWVCDNGITETREKNFVQLWQFHCRKWEEKKIAIGLSLAFSALVFLGPRH